ncbi:hypothetical protein LO763_10805 [Glycomyces sp. A-F 0318]|uniref:hypothetical protein n=1 Tax=Glycomyces amatae TaxID=2881355 RepID=UPI001E3C20DB|nr:hypothetical protein [Glycomyces amatae]MCD0444113.1 hypothetical protein [Glycomyces amatae]
MKPEVWVPSLAALLSPMLPWFIDRVTKPGTANTAHGRRAKRKTLWTAFSTTVAAATVVFWLAPGPWRWPALVGCVVLSVASYALLAWRRARRVGPHPETERFLKEWGGKDGGYPYDRDFLPDLVRVYTKNDLVGTGEPGDPAASRRRKGPDPTRPRGFDDLLADPAVRHLALTGEAGTGKTSLLQFWRHDLRLRRPAHGDALSRLVPLLIPARSLVGLGSVGEAFGPEGPDVLSRPPGAGMRWFLMIDAFDEITDADSRAEVERIVFEAIDEIGDRGHMKFAVTSRGLTDDRRRSFDTRGVSEYRLQSFTDDQLRQYLVREETSGRDIDGRTAAYDAATEKVDRFMDRWEGHDELLELIRLPLLARVTSTIYFQDLLLDIPKRRVDIYQDAIEHLIAQFHKRMSGERDRYAPALGLLREWANAEEPSAADVDAAIRDLLRRLAVAHIESGPESVVPTACDLLGVPMGPKDRQRVRAVLALLDATGLIHDVKAINPSFVHKSFAEYFAAPALFDQGSDVERWNAVLRDPDRRIGAVFALAQMDPERRRELCDAMAETDEFPEACGWIAVEGLCIEGVSGRIDEDQRNRLIQACVRAITPRPKSDWWNLIEALATIDKGRDHLIAKVESREISDWTLERICNEIANHDQRGIMLLKEYAESNSFNHHVRSNAASHLLEHDSEAGLKLLEQLASEPDPDGARRLGTAQALANYQWSEAESKLQSLAVDQFVSSDTRILAVVELIRHGNKKGLKLARRYARHRIYSDSYRVYLAERLANQDHPDGLRLLREFANDDCIEDIAREQAANHLKKFDREESVRLLLEFASDALLSDVVRLQARQDLAQHEELPESPLLIEAVEDLRMDAWTRITTASILETDAPEYSRHHLALLAADTTIEIGARVHALGRLVEFDRPAWFPRLSAIMESADHENGGQAAAARILIEKDPSLGMPILSHLANDARLDDFDRVLVSLGLITGGDSGGLERLRLLAQEPNASSGARVWAAEELAKLDFPKGLACLRRLRTDPGLTDRDRVAATSRWIDLDAPGEADRLRELAEALELDGAARLFAAERLMPYQKPKALKILRALAETPELTDADRCTATATLAKYDRAAGSTLVRRYATDNGLHETARLEAIQAMIALEPDEGMELLRAYACDSTGSDTSAPEGAELLALHGDARGVALLKQYAQDTGIEEQARVNAAEHLLKFDRDTALESLRAHGSNADFNDVARADALSKLAHHDPEIGLRLLHAAEQTRRERPMLAVLVDGALARYEPDAVERLSRTVADQDADDLVRVHAASALVSCDRPIGIAALSQFAETAAFRPTARLMAASSLLPHHRPNAIAVLRTVAEDDRGDHAMRVAAAGLLPSNGRESLQLLRSFIADPEFDELGKVEAAWSLSFECRREADHALAALRASSEEAVRCWADIASADHDADLRAALPERYKGIASPALDRVRDLAATLVEVAPRAGARAKARVEAIAAARAGRPDPLEPDGVLD